MMHRSVGPRLHVTRPTFDLFADANCNCLIGWLARCLRNKMRPLSCLWKPTVVRATEESIIKGHLRANTHAFTSNNQNRELLN